MKSFHAAKNEQHQLGLLKFATTRVDKVFNAKCKYMKNDNKQINVKTFQNCN